MDAAQRQACLDRARGGDAHAWGRLLEAFRPYVRVIVHAQQDRRLRPRLDDSDLVQDALVEAHRVFATFRGTTVAELAGWLRTIVRRSIADAAREHLGAGKRARSREQPLDGVGDLAGGSGSSPSAQAIRHEQAARMAEALTQLSDDMQQVLLGRHVEDLPYAVLAERLGRSEGAVRVLYFRALRKLRELCGEGSRT
jgi:RNA polymerase sigma-70 factor (ECF subfamily)